MNRKKTTTLRSYFIFALVILVIAALTAASSVIPGLQGHAKIDVFITAIGTVILFFVIYNHQFVRYSIRKNEKDLYIQHSQIQSLFSLYSLIDFTYPLPPMRKWVISPDLGTIIYTAIKRHQPNLVVELGSGVSSIIGGYCLKEIRDARLVSFEHDESCANVSKNNIIMHGLDDIVQLKYAPLKQMQFQDKRYLWYDISSVEFDRPIDILIVDGPPQRLCKNARFPALPMLIDHLSRDALIIIDDASRTYEKRMISEWLSMYPDFGYKKYETEKGTVILKRGG
jgi:predicted O-methyltransferase YrrM